MKTIGFNPAELIQEVVKTLPLNIFGCGLDVTIFFLEYRGELCIIVLSLQVTNLEEKKDVHTNRLN